MEIRFGKLLAGAAMTVLCAGLAVVPGSGVAYGADTRHCQISNQSDWVGYYEAKDGSSLIIESVSGTNVYVDHVSAGEESGSGGRDVLAFTDEARTEARSVSLGSRAEGGIRYILNRESLTVEGPDESGAHTVTRYVRRNGKYAWLTLPDGVSYWMQGNGSVLKDGVTPDGWYVGSDGCWDPYMGMGPFRSGTYESHGGTEIYVFQMKEDLSLEEWRLSGPTDKRVVGTVSYYSQDASGGQAADRTDMRLINTMEGYVIVDTEGRVAAKLYPVGASGQLMVKKTGADDYESMTRQEKKEGNQL